MSAIVAAIGIGLGIGLGAAMTVTLGGCGQRGPLYLPSVPPMPQRPVSLQDTPPSEATSADEATSRASRASAASGASGTDIEGDIPDTSGEPLSLAPETDLKTTPAAPQAASSAD